MCPRNFQEIYTTHIRKTYTRWKIPLRRLLVRRYGRRDLSLTQNDTSSSTSVLNFAWNHIIWSWLKFLHTKRSMSLRCSRYTRPRTPSPKSYTHCHFIERITQIMKRTHPVPDDFNVTHQRPQKVQTVGRNPVRIWPQHSNKLSKLRRWRCIWEVRVNH